MKIEILAGWMCLGLMTAAPAAWASELDGGDGPLSQEALENLAFGVDVTVQPGLRWFPDDALNRAGTVLDLGLHLRFSGDYTIGVEGGFALPPLLGESPRDMRTYKVVGRAGGPMDQLWFEVGAGIGQRGASSDFSHAGLSLKAGLQFIPLRALASLSVGLFAGGEAWWSTETCGSSPCVDVGRAPLFAVQAGLSLRFVLPVIRHAGGY